jgi:nitrite reductase/ring-hydroxylating ferredoxin subunit
VSEFVAVARADEIPPGEGRSILVGEKRIAVFNMDGTFHAMDGVCLHRDGPVGEGDLEGAVVTCPWHGWQYDVTTGRNVFDPAIGLETYPVRVEDGAVLVALGARG